MSDVPGSRSVTAFTTRVWVKTIASRTHPERNEDMPWSAANGVAHAIVDGMGSIRRQTPEGELGGEHAARLIVKVLADRLENLPRDLSVQAARELLAAAVDAAGASVFREINMSGNIPASEIPQGKTPLDVMPAAVMTTLIICENGRRAVLGQNGDSRGYLFSNGELLLLTSDQDAVLFDVQNGTLTEEQADALQLAMDSFDGYNIGALDPLAREYFTRRHLAFGEVGDQEHPPPPVFSTIQLLPDDLILLCSDAIYANLTTQEIAAAMSAVNPAAALADRGDARSAGRALPDPNDPSVPYNYRAHQDDFTALVVRVGWEPVPGEVASEGEAGKEGLKARTTRVARKDHPASATGRLLQ